MQISLLETFKCLLIRLGIKEILTLLIPYDSIDMNFWDGGESYGDGNQNNV